MKASELFSLPKSLPFEDYFLPDLAPWEWVSTIEKALLSFDFKSVHSRKDFPPQLIIEGQVYIHPTVKLPPYGYIQGPVYIGANTKLRVGVYIRGNVIVGENCVLGNACEYKNCLLMSNIQTPHFNYVGDSILGSGTHLGAGVVLANLRLDRKKVMVHNGEMQFQTNFQKLGAMIGEFSEIGCNSVLQPGTILGKRVIIGSCLPIGGFVPADKKVFVQNSILK